MCPGLVASPNMRASNAARASPAALNAGSALPSWTFSACRITMITVECAVISHQPATMSTAAPAMAVSASNQMGIKNGRRCCRAKLLMRE